MTYNIYLPVITHDSADQLFNASLGAQIEGAVAGREQWCIPNRVYQWAIRWKNVEAEHGVYVWPADYDENARLLADYETIITVKCTPVWARLWDSVNSPPAPEYYDETAQFIRAVQARYNPKAIEFYNEPDVYRGEGEPEYFGDWVNTGETWYQGGQRYGQALAAIKPNTNSKLLGGALMMHGGSIDFLRGALDAGMQPDAISFHCYISSPDRYNRALELAAQINAVSDWRYRLVITETSVTGNVDTEELRAWQAEYLHTLLRYYREEGIVLVNWYSLANNGWGNADMVWNNTSMPVYGVWRDA
jgi:hypothetical protein